MEARIELLTEFVHDALLLPGRNFIDEEIFILYAVFIEKGDSPFTETAGGEAEEHNAMFAVFPFNLLKSYCIKHVRISFRKYSSYKDDKSLTACKGLFQKSRNLRLKSVHGDIRKGCAPGHHHGFVQFLSDRFKIGAYAFGLSSDGGDGKGTADKDRIGSEGKHLEYIDTAADPAVDKD
jgi:hypothetical protein